MIFEHLLADGRRGLVVPLTYGRARLQVFAPGEADFAQDEW